MNQESFNTEFSQVERYPVIYSTGSDASSLTVSLPPAGSNSCNEKAGIIQEQVKTREVIQTGIRLVDRKLSIVQRKEHSQARTNSCYKDRCLKGWMGAYNSTTSTGGTWSKEESLLHMFRS